MYFKHNTPPFWKTTCCSLELLHWQLPVHVISILNTTDVARSFKLTEQNCIYIWCTNILSKHRSDYTTLSLSDTPWHTPLSISVTDFSSLSLSLSRTHTHTHFSLSPKYTLPSSLSHTHTHWKQTKNCVTTLGLCTQPLSISLSHTGMHRPYADSVSKVHVPLFHITPSVQTNTLTCPNTLHVVNTYTIQTYTKMNFYSHCSSFYPKSTSACDATPQALTTMYKKYICI